MEENPEFLELLFLFYENPEYNIFENILQPQSLLNLVAVRLDSVVQMQFVVKGEFLAHLESEVLIYAHLLTKVCEFSHDLLQVRKGEHHESYFRRGRSYVDVVKVLHHKLSVVQNRPLVETLNDEVEAT